MLGKARRGRDAPFLKTSPPIRVAGKIDESIDRFREIKSPSVQGLLTEERSTENPRTVQPVINKLRVTVSSEVGKTLTDRG